MNTDYIRIPAKSLAYIILFAVIVFVILAVIISNRSSNQENGTTGDINLLKQILHNSTQTNLLLACMIEQQQKTLLPDYTEDQNRTPIGFKQINGDR